MALRPATEARITGGLWGGRREVDRDVCIPEGWDRLPEAGNFHNLRRVEAGPAASWMSPVLGDPTAAEPLWRRARKRGCRFTAVPYFPWGNRGEGAMRV